MSRRTLAALVAAGVFAAVVIIGAPAWAPKKANPQSSSATVVANAILADPAVLAGASTDAGKGAGEPLAYLATGAVGLGFPTNGANLGVLSTGRSDDIREANSEANLSNTNGGSDLNGRDLTQLKVTVNPPADRNCLSFDFQFLSEEFSEFIGSNFNDHFVAEIGASNLSVTGNTLNAPSNFVKDPNGKQISVNNAFTVNATNAAGTTYDGATPRLSSQTQIPTSRPVDIVFSIMDIGDSAFDSTVLIDNVAFSNNPNCVTATGTTLPPPTGGTGGPPPACPGPLWYLAEGVTQDGTDEYLLLLNTATSDAQVSVTYLVEGGGPVAKQHSIPAQSRLTIPVFEAANLGRGKRHGTIVSEQNGKPILVERSQFVKAVVNGVSIDGDFNAIAVGLPQKQWVFAEGTTLQGFITFLNLANPNTSPAAVTIDFGIEGGQTKQVKKTIPAQSRLTLDMSSADGPGSNVQGFATSISSDVPIVAERTIGFDRMFDFGTGPKQISGLTGAFGTQPGTAWHAAEGNVLATFNEFLTVGNFGPAPAAVTVTYNLEGASPIQKPVTVQPNSRLTIQVFNENDASGGGIGRNVSNPVSRGVGVSVTSNQPVVVERIMYFDHPFDPTLPRIQDGHAVGAWPRFNKVWYFAEGTGLFDFRTFLTLSNPQTTDAAVTISYFPDDKSGTVNKNIVVPAGQRTTVQTYSASDPGGYGAGKTGFSIKVSSSVPILAERPSYEFRQFPDIGTVNGGNVSIGLPDECVPFG